MSTIVEKNVKNSLPTCNTCKNHIEGLKCKAFNVIPDVILFGKDDHSKPLPKQDNDIVYEQIDNTKPS